MVDETRNVFWSLGCLIGASGVALGAFGAHGLKRVVTDLTRLKSWETAAYYQMLHALPLLIIANRQESNWGGTLMIAGIGLFSGSIYGLVLRPNWRFLGPITPIGGILLVAGWISLAFQK